MDTLDRPDANLPARMSASSSHLPAQVPAAHRELAVATTPSTVNSHLLLRGLARNWWRILLLWVIVSTPLVFLIYYFVEPTYKASSKLRVEPGKPELFGTGAMGSDERGFQPYLQTQRSLILTDRVLDAAVADPRVVNCPMIRSSTDPKGDLREKLVVENTRGTYLIEISLESTDPKEAADIVTAVVDAFQKQHKEYGHSDNTVLIGNYQKWINQLEDEIKKKKDRFVELVEKGKVQFSKPQVRADTKSDENDQTISPAFDKLTPELYKSASDRLFQTDLEWINVKSQYEAKLAEAQSTSVAPASSQVDNQLLQKEIEDEFLRDPDVAAVREEIRSTQEELEHTKGIVRRNSDPARVAAAKQLAKLNKEYHELWRTRKDEIRKRLLMIETGARTSGETLSELKFKVDELTRTKVGL